MDNDIFIITFEGSQTIEKAEEIKAILLSSIKGKKREILLNLSRVEKIDLSFLQLIYSSSLEAVKKNKKISITGKIPENIKNLIKLSGYNKKTANNPLFLME